LTESSPSDQAPLPPAKLTNEGRHLKERNREDWHVVEDTNRLLEGDGAWSEDGGEEAGPWL